MISGCSPGAGCASALGARPRFPWPSAAPDSRGEVLLTVGLIGTGDAEPRDDSRLWLVQVTPTPGIVILASPSDWDGRFLFRTLREVAQLPIRGYARIEPGRWRSMENLAPVGTDEVTQAARRADVLVIKGAVPELDVTPGPAACGTGRAARGRDGHSW